MLLRFFIIGRLVLVQQLHRSLVMRLDPDDAHGASRDAKILRRITQLPGLLPEAGVPPWIVTGARRRADRASRDATSGVDIPHRNGLNDLEADALRASLIIRQLRPSETLWQPFSELADELRDRLVEWEWIELIVAWTACGLLPTNADAGDNHAIITVKRLSQVGYQRPLEHYDSSRETDSRDLAAWTVADVIQRRASKLESNLTAGATSVGALWDQLESAAFESVDTLRTSVAGFSSRDPFVWLMLSVPTVNDPSTWIAKHFIVDETIRWRGRTDEEHVTAKFTEALAGPRRHPDRDLPDLDGTLASKVTDHPINDATYLIATRGAGPSDLGEIFRRCAATETVGRHRPRVPLRARADTILLPMLWFSALRRSHQGLVGSSNIAIIVLLNS